MTTDKTNSDVAFKVAQAFICEYCLLLPEHVNEDDVKCFFNVTKENSGDVYFVAQALKKAISALSQERISDKDVEWMAMHIEAMRFKLVGKPEFKDSQIEYTSYEMALRLQEALNKVKPPKQSTEADNTKGAKHERS